MKTPLVYILDLIQYSKEKMDETPRKQAKTPSAPIKKGAYRQELVETDTKRKLFEVQDPVQKKGKLNGSSEDVVPVVARRTRFIQKNQEDLCDSF